MGEHLGRVRRQDPSSSREVVSLSDGAEYHLQSPPGQVGLSRLARCIICDFFKDYPEFKVNRPSYLG